MKSQALVSSSIGIILVAMVGYLIIFVKEAVFAAYFGVSAQTDAFVVAVQLPVILFAVVAVGIRTVVLPVYSRRRLESEEYATLFARNIMTIALIFSALFACVGIGLADWIVHLFAPGFSPETHKLAVNLLRISFPIIVFTMQADIYSAMLNARKSFGRPQMAAYFQNILLIGVILLLYRWIGIYAAIIGTLLGTVAQCAYLSALLGNHFRYRPYLDLNDEDIRRTGRMSVPVIISVGIAEINRFVSQIIASRLGTGNIASLNYAMKLNGIFSSLLVQAITVVAYPYFFELIQRKDFSSLNRLINGVLAVLVMVVFPLTTVLLMFSPSVVGLAFARGAFDSAAITQTSRVFIFFNLGLLFIVLREIVSRVYYSFEDTKGPMVNAGIGVSVNIMLNIVLGRTMGAPGLALATSISSCIICCLLLFGLRKKYAGYHLRDVGTAALKTVISSAGMAGCILTFGYFVPIADSTYALLAAIGVGALAYLAALLLLRTKELYYFMGMASTMVQKHL